MKKYISLSFLLLCGFLISACTPKTAVEAPTKTDVQASEYTAQSWKEIIPDTCQNFFDGCNTCRRMPDGGAACTRMMCQTYKKPECRDAEANTSETSENTVVDDYIGLTLEEAQKRAEEQGVPFRVVEKDGHGLPVTMDWRPGRINATVEDTIVVDYSIEGQEENKK